MVATCDDIWQNGPEEVLVVGGHRYDRTQFSGNVGLLMAQGAELFDPARGFTTAAPLGTDRRWHAAAKLGSDLLVNVWGYCFASPFFDGELPRGLLHPRRVRDGVRVRAKGDLTAKVDLTVSGASKSAIAAVERWRERRDLNSRPPA